MKVFGIVFEANPLHLGHIYFIDKIKKEHRPDFLIAITSTSFSMRGDISILDKFTKTKLLLDQGIDIILELPFTMAVQSADYFAKNSINILNNLNITDIAFGSETTSKELYYKLYEYLKKHDDEFKNYKSISKKQALSEIIESSFSIDEQKVINKANFTLGFQYVKTILDENLPINFHMIKRIDNDYHDLIPNSNIASATSIRNLHQNQKDVTNYIPYDKSSLTDLNHANNNIMSIIKYLYSNNDVINLTYFGKSEGINNYILNSGNFNSNYDALVESLKNKKYTSSLIKRVILHTLLKTDKNLFDFNYLRLLGANKKGFLYLNGLTKQQKQLIFSNPNEINYPNSILNYELQATKLYANITNNNPLYLNEFKLPIRKEDQQ